MYKSPPRLLRKSSVPGIPGSGEGNAPLAARKAPAKFKPRRKPRQARASRTIESLLDAAGAVLEKVGLDGFSTDRVAAEAGMAVGSIYQYFPDKYHLLHALAERWYERDMGGLVSLDRDTQIDRMAELYRNEPGGASLLEAIQVIPKLSEYHQHYMEQEIQRTAAQLARGRRPGARDVATARVIVTAINAVLVEATRRSQRESNEMIAAMKSWLSALTALRRISRD